MPRILLVDDDTYMSHLLSYALEREGFDVVTAASGRDALREFRAARFDLAILDVNLPDTNGFRVLAALRALSNLPIVMLTARSQDEDVIAGFEQGANDYVTKPFSHQVLITRVKALLRRNGAFAPATALPETTYRLDGLEFDPSTHQIKGAGTLVRLTRTESRILHLLCQFAGQPLAAQTIMEHIWGPNSVADINVVKTHIRNMREKIGSLPGHPNIIQTLPGVGYMIRGHQQAMPDTTLEF